VVSGQALRDTSTAGTRHSCARANHSNLFYYYYPWLCGAYVELNRGGDGVQVAENEYQRV